MSTPHHRGTVFSGAAPSRRLFLKMASGALAAGFGAGTLSAHAAQGERERNLRLYNTHTGEQSNTVYWADNAYQPDGVAELSRLLRDHRSNEVGAIDTGLLDLIFLMSASLDTRERFQVISGYRSPATNAMLNKTTSGVATRSLHMDGLAIDIRVPGRKLADVRRTAIALKGGGVGYYPDSDFVHLDVGRVRTW